MRKKIVVIGVIVVFIVLLSGCVFSGKSGTGKITDKWDATIKNGFGSSTGYFFEINNSYYIGVTAFEYKNYNINDTFSYSDREINPPYDKSYLP